MRPIPALIALGLLAGIAVAWRVLGAAPPARLPPVALMTFAVAAFSGPVR